MNEKKKCSLLLLLVCVVWAGAALYKYTQTRAPGKTVLTAVLYRGNEEARASLALLAGEFQNQYPDIEITVLDRSPADIAGDLDPERPKSRNGPGVPDIIIADEKSLAVLAGELLEPLDSLLQNPLLAAELALEGGPPRRIIPLVSFMYPLYYNIAALREAGFDRPPKTREEFFAYADRLPPLSAAVSPAGGAEELAAWTWAAGFNFFEGEALHNAALGDSLNFIQDMIGRGFLDPLFLEKTETEKYDEFIAGRIAMMSASIAGTGYIREHAPDLEYGITTVPPPSSYTGKPRFALGNWGASLPAQSPRKEEAKLFIAFLSGARANALLAHSLSGIPVNSSARAVSGGTPRGDQYDKALAILEAGEAVNEFAFPPGGPALEEALREAAGEIMSGRKTPGAYITELEARWFAAGDGN
ncbi:MAG: extracellular solute-binding protein [Spirochaetaceae bacterium]|nr:extracellular solute-binding protein [Spirochaetaceae bacterium]